MIEFNRGRDGYHRMCPFECDSCIFHKLRGSDPNLNPEIDKLHMCYIRRLNLDAFWSRETSTVHGNNNRAQIIQSYSLFGLEGLFTYQVSFSIIITMDMS